VNFRANHAIALAALAVIGALAFAIALDASPAVRLPLTVALLTVVPGVGIVGYVDLERSPAEWATLVVAVSLAASTLLCAALAGLGWITPGATVTAFAATCAPLLLAQLTRRHR
jgi:hypothetical protein